MEAQVAAPRHERGYHGRNGSGQRRTSYRAEHQSLEVAQKLRTIAIEIRCVIPHEVETFDDFTNCANEVLPKRDWIFECLAIRVAETT